jgi:hypothetical protein
MAAFNGTSLQTSTEFYKVYANKTALSSDASFITTAKAAIEKDISTNLAGFKIDSEKTSEFSGSTAYVVTTSDNAEGVAVVEAAVYHPVSSGQNVFILVHAATGSTIDLNGLETQWQWK